MNKQLQRLIDAANKASNRTRWGIYPMAPSVGLSEKEISLHQKAVEAHSKAYQALIQAKFQDEAELHQKAIDNHSWVTQRLGVF